MPCRGIDVSFYNGTIDWERVREAGAEFAILRVIDRDLQPDEKFETYYRDALAAEVEIQGVYEYSYAVDVEGARRAADRVVSVLGRRRCMVWLDLESVQQRRLENERLLNIVRESRRVYQRSGFVMGVYTDLYFYNEKIRPLAAAYEEIPFWIAAYPTGERRDIRKEPDARDRPQIANELYGWQYSDYGAVPGVEARATDLDLWYAQIPGRNCEHCLEETESTA